MDLEGGTLSMRKESGLNPEGGYPQEKKKEDWGMQRWIWTLRGVTLSMIQEKERKKDWKCGADYGS